MKTKPPTKCGRFSGLDLTSATQLTADYSVSPLHDLWYDKQFFSGAWKRIFLKSGKEILKYLIKG
jgi:hypothetical protein